VREQIFKGATRPPMKWGVPLMFAVGLLIPTFVATIWVGYLVSYWVAPLPPLIGGAAFLWMRTICARDDQRLYQRLKALKLKWLNRGRVRIEGLRSYSPYRSWSSTDVWRQ
jgi:type IV secretion system protein VirB3